MADFVKSHGNVFVAHRLRRSSDQIVDQMSESLNRLGLDVPPRGASMLLLIDEHAAIGVVEVSRRLRLSHPLIVRMARRFEALGLVAIEADPADARRRLLVLTVKGRREAAAVRALNARLSVVFDAVFAEIDCALVATLDRLDSALDARSLMDRLFNQATT